MNKTHDHILLSIKNSKKIINLQNTNYPIIKQIALNQLDFQLGIDHYTFLWTDNLLSIKQIRSLQYPIRVNHFPQISQITRKNKLAMNLNHMRVHFPKDYDFYPQTWITPVDLHKIFKKHTKNKIYIIKPESGCQGKGILLIDNPNKIDKNNPFVVQEYLQKPYLLNGLKFDMRIYVLITSVTPLRVYLYKDGIVRFATQKFQKANSDNLTNNFSHLTNYAINKNNQNFNEDQKLGHKRALTSVFTSQQISSLYYQFTQIILKTIISTLPSLQSSYLQCKKLDPSSCFQLLGFDIILDQNKKAFLLQVNQNPSLHTDTLVDNKIKSKMIRNIIKIVSGGLPNIFQDKLQNKMKLKDRHEMTNIGEFERIYPIGEGFSIEKEKDKYEKYIMKSQQIYNDKFGMNIIRNNKKKQQITSQSNTNHLIQSKEHQQYNIKQQYNYNKLYPSTPNNTFQNSNHNYHNNHIPLSQKNISTFYYSKQKMKNIYKTPSKRYVLPNTLGKRKIQI